MTTESRIAGLRFFGGPTIEETAEGSWKISFDGNELFSSALKSNLAIIAGVRAGLLHRYVISPRNGILLQRSQL